MSSTYTFTVTVPFPLIFVWIFVEFKSTFLSYTLSSPTFTVSFFSFTVVELDEPVVFVEVQYGTYFGEDDIVRIEDDYNRAWKSSM